MHFKKKIIFLFIIIFALGMNNSSSYFTFETIQENNALNNVFFPKVRIRIYQVTMPIIHEDDEDEYISLFKDIAINKIIPVINNPTTMDKISTSKRLEFSFKKDIKFHANEISEAKILHHIVAISNGSPFGDGREKINLSKKKLECELDNVYLGEKSNEFYSVDFKKNDVHGGKMSLKEKEKYIETFTWDDNKKQYLVNKKYSNIYYNADLILFDFTSFIIDDLNTVDNLREEMEKYGDEVVRLYSTYIKIALTSTSSNLKVTKSQLLELLRE